MRVLILHQEVPDDATPDEADVLAQVRAVDSALTSLGHRPQVLALPDDLRLGEQLVREAAPEVVFNLVESLEGQGRLAHLAPELLDRLEVAYTGNDAGATYRTTSKLLAKEALRECGLPTPPWSTLGELRAGAAVAPGRYVLKSVWEHGSLGLDDSSVVAVARAAELLAELEERLPRLGGEGFAEAYVPGREFNLALLEGPDGPACLPPAEIRFAPGDKDQPRIVGYRAKWSPGSPEDRATPRNFEFPRSDDALLGRLCDLARATWQQLGLGGYARIDVRVDTEPQIVDVNTNPCLSPDAGFQAGLVHAGVSFADAVSRLLDAALARRRA